MSTIYWTDGRRSVRGRWAAVLVAVVAVLALGFGGFQLWRANRVAQAEAALQTPPQSGILAVGMRNSAFSAPNIAVAQGATITWTNDDDTQHNVVFSSGGVASSPLLDQGQTFQATFNTLGEYRYVCTLHASMIAKVTVTP